MCGTFGNYAIVPEMSLVKIDDDVDLRYAALIGCGVLTGVGAALNTASIRPGDTVAVVGCGGVGLNVIQGAKIAGAEKIIAVDMFESKLKMAEQFGATDLVKADEGDAVTNVVGLTRRARRRRRLRGDRPRPDDRADHQHDAQRRRGDPRRRAAHGRDAEPERGVHLPVPGQDGEGLLVRVEQRPRGHPEADPALQGRQRSSSRSSCSREIGVDGVNEAFTAMQSGEVARSLITPPSGQSSATGSFSPRATSLRSLPRAAGSS